MEQTNNNTLVLQGNRTKFLVTNKLLDTVRGSVYEGVQLASNRKSTPSAQVVVKISNRIEDVEQDSSKKRRIPLEDAMAEIRIMKALPKHVNIVEYVDDFEVLTESRQRLQVLVLENMTGGDLFNHIAAKGRLSEKDARLYFKQILTGMEWMHRHGVCHLDISPENVLLTADKQVAKLCDFGQSRVFFDSRKKVVDLMDKKTQTKLHPGKNMYMAPEILSNEQTMVNGEKADLYSLGIVLFCMLFGFQPYKKPSLYDPGFLSILSGNIEELFILHGIKIVETLTDSADSTDLQVSGDAFDLLCELLTDSRDRLSTTEVFKHSWLT